MSWIDGSTDRESLLATLPDIAAAFEPLYAALWQQPHVPPDIIELCRLRLAQLHRSDADRERRHHPVPETQRAALCRWNKSGEFSPGARACLSFCEVYAMDAGAIADEHADAVKLHFGEAGLVALIEALGVLDGMTRLSLLWQLPAPGPQQGGEPEQNAAEHET